MQPTQLPNAREDTGFRGSLATATTYAGSSDRCYSKDIRSLNSGKVPSTSKWARNKGELNGHLLNERSKLTSQGFLGPPQTAISGEVKHSKMKRSI